MFCFFIYLVNYFLGQNRKMPAPQYLTRTLAWYTWCLKPSKEDCVRDV